MNKRAIILFACALLLSQRCIAQEQSHQYKDSTISCEYETFDGRIHGKYISYYPNGQKRAEGNFENAYRIGNWTVWDSEGNLCVQRDYKNPFIYKKIIPEVSTDLPIKLLDIPQYDIVYNEEGFIEDFYLDERMIMWSKRNWRLITPQNNAVFFENNNLFNVFSSEINNNNITSYSAENDDFTIELPPSDIQLQNKEIIGFKIKEDWFFENERFVTEVRILGICPVVRDTETNDTLDLYWLYFPELRKHLAQNEIQENVFPQKVKTLDDVFFYRCFSSQIYKESNVYDREIKDYKSGAEIEKEAETIEIRIIEAEHCLWLHFAGKAIYLPMFRYY